jgi:hypothetical protein
MRVRFRNSELGNSATAIMIALAAAAVISCCVCCVGGLADALSPPYAIGFITAAASFGLAAAGLGAVRVWRLFRPVHRVAATYLRALRAGDAEFAEPLPSDLTAYRINGIQVYNGDEAQVTARLTFADGSRHDLVLSLLREAYQWRIYNARRVAGTQPAPLDPGEAGAE